MHKKLTLHSGQETLQKLGVKRREFPLAPRFAIAPGQTLGAVVAGQGGRVFRGFHWGLVPAWWTDEQKETQRLFTARAESLLERPSFAQAVKTNRAVVPVDGFWVWHEVEGESIPFFFKARDGEPLYLAAIWEESDDGFGRMALISVPANRLVEPLSTRMPAILRGDDVDLWLGRTCLDTRKLQKTLVTPPSRFLTVSASDENASGRAGLDDSEEASERMLRVYGGTFNAEKPRFAPRRRRVRRDYLAGGQLFFRTRSFTREDATLWHPIVDIENGQVFCDCPDFRYRHARHEPDVWTPQWWCKHVSRAVANCKSHGELPLQQ